MTLALCYLYVLISLDRNFTSNRKYRNSKKCTIELCFFNKKIIEKKFWISIADRNIFACLLIYEFFSELCGEIL